jgi:orotidine-5'-phosphate decarboxylase
MNYLKLLENKSKETNSIVCMGIDPILEKIPIKQKPGNAILKFYLDILERIVAENVRPACVKPNIAFYEQYGFEGLRALRKLIRAYKKAKIPVILDAKEAYAKAIFEFWKADAVTIAPYMGSDSVSPFIQWCDKGKGVYVLVRTSNKGAVDLQNLNVDGTPIYKKTAERLTEWQKDGTGAVIGATYPLELEELSTFFVSSGKKIPLLIPGVGSQGGSAKDVAEILRKTNNPLYLHRINSSSEINYAYLKENTQDYAGAAVRTIKKLNDEIGPIF